MGLEDELNDENISYPEVMFPKMSIYRDIIKRSLLRKFILFCTINNYEPWILRKDIAVSYGLPVVAYSEGSFHQMPVKECVASLESFDFISKLFVTL